MILSQNVLDFVLNLQLPTQDQLKTVLDKVKDWFGDAKESFGKLTALNTTPTEEAEGAAAEKTKVSFMDSTSFYSSFS